MAIFGYKTGDACDFWPKPAHPLRLQPHIYIYIYAVKLLIGPRLGVFNGY